MTERNLTRRVEDKRADSAADWSDAPRFNALNIAETWSVTVEAEGQRVLSISDDSVSGLDGDKFDQFTTTVRNCAMHLLGFIGSSPIQASTASSSVAVDLDKLEALARAADPHGAAHLVTHYRNNANVQAEEAWRRAASPAAILSLIALARSNSPAASTQQANDAKTIGPNMYRKTALVHAEQFLPAEGKIPAGVYSDGYGDPRKNPLLSWVVDTKEGMHTLRNGDYICTGPAGERWNVEQSIFESTYELAGGAASGDKEQANEESSGASMHDVVIDLRAFADNPGYSHNDYADTMRQAAHCIESLRAMLFNFGRIVADSESGAASTASVAAPEGWKLVPVKPTPEMLATLDHADATMDRVYRAMIVAAPEFKDGSVAALEGLTAAQFEEIAQGWDGCSYPDSMIDDIGAALRADYERLVAAGSASPAAPDMAELKKERDRFERMFMAACTDLGAINEVLGLDPDDGGAEPIIEAINELEAKGASPAVAGKSIITGPLLERLMDECTDRHFGLMAEPFARAVEREVLAHASVGAKEPAGHVVDVDRNCNESIINVALEPGTEIYLAAPSSEDVRNAALPDVEEAAEILESFINNVAEDGPYGAEATLTFIGQAKQCVDAAARALKAETGESK